MSASQKLRVQFADGRGSMYVCAQLIIDAPDVNIKLVPASESLFTKIFFPFFFFYVCFLVGGVERDCQNWEGSMEPKIYRKRDGVLVACLSSQPCPYPSWIDLKLSYSLRI